MTDAFDGPTAPGSQLPISSPADLRRTMGTDFEVSAQQWAAISAPLEPAVVIAGAGSGKTALMAARVVYLVANRIVEPGQVLGLTFTTKAAAELGSRIRTSLAQAGFAPGQSGSGQGELPPPVWEQDDAEELLEPTVATYNGYASSLLAEHGLRIGHEPDTRVMADASRYQLAARAIAKHRGRVELLSDHPDTVVKYILGLEGAMSEHLVEIAEVHAFHAREMPRVQAVIDTARAKADARRVLDAMHRREELLGLVATYRRLKSELGLMDFSDQIALAARLADEHPEVGTQERQKFRVVLLDEYQDTSVAQALMLKELFGGGHAVTAVGDPNQAIYGWRGASVANILGFGHDFPRADGSPDVPILPLTVNRRSDRRILETANRLAAPLLEKFPQVRPLDPGEGAAEGRVRASVHETYAAELEWLADQVQATHAAMDEPKWSEIGVLTRDNAHAADVFDVLSARQVPVEIVGLNGLLRLPEVAEVVATLTLLNDLTANAALLTLLTGPRWAIGPRDLALLGERARVLAGTGRQDTERSLGEQLSSAVEGADPTELSSLNDALDDPGDAPYSRAALERFGLLRAELRTLRGHVGDPLLDLVRRIIDTTGIDIELASSTSPAAGARRDNLDLFVKAVAEFQAIDGEVSLTALLAYLETEDEMGTGLDVATPTEADSVKLLTVHRSKGLEWDTVFVVGVGEEKFPTTRSRTQWIHGPGVLPNPLRGDRHSLAQLSGYEKDQLAAMVKDAKELEQEEELRLGYVAFTRARHTLSVSSYVWNDQRKSPIGPSPYQAVVRECLDGWGERPDSWLTRPGPDVANPLLAEVRQAPWPVTEHTAEALRRIAAAEQVEQVDPDADDELDLVEASVAEAWDTELDRLLAEARRDRAEEVEVSLPSSMSATTVARIGVDPEGLARDLARPMPRQPSASARFGTRFHAWVEARFGQQSLLDPDDLPGRADLGIDDDSDLKELTERFAAGPFGHRVPHAVEAPFAMVLAGQVVRGRIDAVYVEEDGTHLVIDWKTNRVQDADPMQLAIYRLAWAELQGLPLTRVRAAFHYVRPGTTDDRTDDLLDRDGLAAWVLSAGSDAE